MSFLINKEESREEGRKHFYDKQPHRTHKDPYSLGSTAQSPSMSFPHPAAVTLLSLVLTGILIVLGADLLLPQNCSNFLQETWVLVPMVPDLAQVLHFLLPPSQARAPEDRGVPSV